jgi:hypothetical protein
VGARWGNVVLPEGDLRVDDEFRFEDSPPGDVHRVIRINVFPPEKGKRLYYYLRVRDNPTNS